MTSRLVTRPPAILVPAERREGFLPKLFGVPLMIVGEHTVYTLMEKLSPRDYGGGVWDFYERAGAPLFLAPTSKPRFQIVPDITQFEGEVSAEAAGIIVTLFAFSHLSFRHNTSRLADGYDRLYRYMAGHEEASAILQAID